jgi:hypothetical protein
LRVSGFLGRKIPAPPPTSAPTACPKALGALSSTKPNPIAVATKIERTIANSVIAFLLNLLEVKVEIVFFELS